MSGYGTRKPCTQIPGYFNGLTMAKYEETRPIREIIKIYFIVTRESQAESGRLTALCACGSAGVYISESFLIIILKSIKFKTKTSFGGTQGILYFKTI